MGTSSRTCESRGLRLIPEHRAILAQAHVTHPFVRTNREGTTTMKTLKFGVEIELNGSKAAMVRAIHSVVGGHADTWGHRVVDTRGRVWNVVPDGSLTGSVENGEVVTPILGYEDLDEFLRVVSALRAAGCRPDQQCAVHVHVGVAHLPIKALTNLVKLVYKQERLIEHALGIQERRLGHYCKPIREDFMRRLEARKPKTREALRAIWYEGTPSEHRSRYAGVNLHAFFTKGTTEFRYFEGTNDPEKIKAYVQLCLSLVATARDAKGAVSSRRPFDPATAKYDFRTFLLRLGFIGPEYKTARKHLLARLGGSAAWKGARRDKGARSADGGRSDGDGRAAAA
jgi:hypothetical protein